MNNDDTSSPDAGGVSRRSTLGPTIPHSSQEATSWRTVIWCLASTST